MNAQKTDHAYSTSKVKRYAPYPSPSQLNTGHRRQTASPTQAPISPGPDSIQWNLPASASEVAPKGSSNLKDWLLQKKAEFGERGEFGYIVKVILEAGDFERAKKKINQSKITRSEKTLRQYFTRLEKFKREWEQKNKSVDPMHKISVSEDGPSTSQRKSVHTSAENKTIQLEHMNVGSSSQGAVDTEMQVEENWGWLNEALEDKLEEILSQIPDNEDECADQLLALLLKSQEDDVRASEMPKDLSPSLPLPNLDPGEVEKFFSEIERPA